jgi:hypothetical protein
MRSLRIRRSRVHPENKSVFGAPRNSIDASEHGSAIQYPSKKCIFFHQEEQRRICGKMRRVVRTLFLLLQFSLTIQELVIYTYKRICTSYKDL